MDDQLTRETAKNRGRKRGLLVGTWMRHVDHLLEDGFYNRSRHTVLFHWMEFAAELEAEDSLCSLGKCHLDWIVCACLMGLVDGEST